MKLRNKLILSCAALAAVATTAVSTTFAWYTSNTEVSADKIYAQTSTAGDDTLLISSTGATGTWSSKVSLNVTEVLKPVSWGANGNGKTTAATPAADDNFYAWDGNTNAVILKNADESSAAINIDSTPSKVGDTDVVAGQDGVLHFKLYFKNLTKAGNVYVTKLTVTNTTGALPTKQLLTTTGLTGMNTTKVKTYSVDLLRATNSLIKTYNPAFSNTDDEGYVLGNEVDGGRKVVEFDSFHDATNKKDSLDSGEAGTVATAYNAHDYYNAVKGLPIGKSGDDDYQPAIANTDPLVTNKIGAENASKWALGATTTSNMLVADFCIFLNGWDLACFDAVQGQKFSIEMEYSTSDKTAVMLK
jgi:hypothetical protein